MTPQSFAAKHYSYIGHVRMYYDDTRVGAYTYVNATHSFGQRV